MLSGPHDTSQCLTVWNDELLYGWWWWWWLPLSLFLRVADLLLRWLLLGLSTALLAGILCLDDMIPAPGLALKCTTAGLKFVCSEYIAVSRAPGVTRV